MAEPQLVSGTGPPIAAPLQLEHVPRNLVELLGRQADRHGGRAAFTFLQEDGGETTLTYGELDRRARAIAATLQQLAAPGQRALLVYPPGVDFICGFFGCIYAGVLAVPATYPKPRRPMPRLTAIATDCDASVALTTSQTLATLDFDRIQPDLRCLRWVATDQLPDDAAPKWACPEIDPGGLAFLQYTSGSTSDPKGVMVSHRNLLHNLEMISRGFAIGRARSRRNPNTGVFWLPSYHDMGLIGGILETLYVSGHTILMPPASFLQRPIRWLEAVSRYRADISGAPNFAYELCVNKTTPEQRAALDLRSWNVAFCGAEPIRAETLERFAETFAPCGFRLEAFYPCYGLAEATLIAAGGTGPARPIVKRVLRHALTNHRVENANGHPDDQIQKLVGCGGALLDQEIVIADQWSHRRCGPDRVGEIWVKGPSVAQGYWNRPEENEHTFGARLADSDGQTYLRTGDLGFLSDGQLFITGRVKDVIIIRGRNHYPQDIERTAQQAHPALYTSAGAAFSIEADGQERLVVIHEIDRQYRDLDLNQVIRKVRQAIAVQHELEAYAVVLIRQASLPMTTSGKAQRNLCREQYLAGNLKVLAQWARSAPPDRPPANGNASCNPPQGDVADGNGAAEKRPQQLDAPPPAARTTPPGHCTARFARSNERSAADQVDRLAERIESWLLDWMVERAAVPRDGIDPDKPFAEYGLDSLAAVQLSQEIEDWLHVRLTAVVAWNYPTPALLARYLACEASGKGCETPETGDAANEQSAGQFERLLSEIEALSDSDAQAALDGELRGGAG